MLNLVALGGHHFWWLAVSTFQPPISYSRLLRASAKGRIWLSSKKHFMPRKTAVQAIFLSQQLWSIVKKNVALWWETRGNPWRRTSPRMCPSWQDLSIALWTLSCALLCEGGGRLLWLSLTPVSQLASLCTLVIREKAILNACPLV